MMILQLTRKYGNMVRIVHLNRIEPDIFKAAV
jgi:hypothetical protein